MTDHSLPHVNCNFNAVKTKLVDSGCIPGGWWADFDKDHTKSAAHKNNVFKALEDIFTDIVHHAKGYICSDNGGSSSEADEGVGSGGGSGEAGESTTVVVRQAGAATIIQSHYSPITTIPIL